MSSPVLYHRRGDAVWLTMDRPESRNPLNREMVTALRGALTRAAAEDRARAVVLAGAGSVFCAGADVREYVRASERSETIAEGENLYDLLEEIAACRLPVIARVQRAAFGGAFGLVAACDLVVAAEGTRFSLSEAKLGLVPAVIGPAVLRSLGPKVAKALMLLAEPFDTIEAQRLGLVQRVVPEAELDATVDGLVASLNANAPGALRDIKRLVVDLADGAMTPAERRAHVTALAAGRRADPEGQEGLTAFLEKRRPNWNPEPVR